MQTKDSLEKTGSSLVQNIFKRIKPIYVFCAVLPLIFIYPKPLMYILKPIIRNWSFHYRKINLVSNKPTQIILASNPQICFSKQQIKKITILKGTLPEAFRLISESILDQQKLRENQDESVKHMLIKTKYEFQKQRIFDSCYIIDMEDTYLQKGQRKIFQESLNLSMKERKNSDNQLQSKDSDQPLYGEIDCIWVEMILMKLKVLQLQNNCEAIKHVIIKANERVLQLLQAKILGIQENQAYKLGVIGQNKIHLLKLNKSLETYEQCSATFKIQQKSDLNSS